VLEILRWSDVCDQTTRIRLVQDLIEEAVDIVFIGSRKRECLQ
jgi:hypothetical protein